VSYSGLGSLRTIEQKVVGWFYTQPQPSAATQRNVARLSQMAQQTAAAHGVSMAQVPAAAAQFEQHVRTVKLPTDITTLGKTADEKSQLKTLSVQMRKAATQIVDAALAQPMSQRKAFFQRKLTEFNPDVAASDVATRYQTLLLSSTSQRTALVSAIVPELIKGSLIHITRAAQASTSGKTQAVHGLDGFGRYEFSGMGGVDGLGGLCDAGQLCPQTGIYPSLPQADATCCADPSWCAELDEFVATFVSFYKQGAWGQGGMMGAANRIMAMAPPPGQRSNNPLTCAGGPLAPPTSCVGCPPGTYTGWADLHQSLIRVMGSDPDLPGVLFAMWNEYFPGGPGYPPTILGFIPATVTTAIGDFFAGPIGQIIVAALAVIAAAVCTVVSFGACAVVLVGVAVGSAIIAAAAASQSSAQGAVAAAAAPWTAAGVTAAQVGTSSGTTAGGGGGVLSQPVGGLPMGVWLAGAAGLALVGVLLRR
jgi:hypothetical protein